MPRPTPPPEDPIRPHVYDGIQEYDKRLPNWWLITLYATIAFAVVYWCYYEWWKAGPDGPTAVTAELNVIEATRLAAAPANDNGSLWKMSRNPTLVESGRATFQAFCASCHTANLTGAIGPNLVDKLWIHGGQAVEILAIVEKGVPAKGMPAWGPVIGARKSAEVVSFILSHHQEGEPVEKQESWTPRPAG